MKPPRFVPLPLWSRSLFFALYALNPLRHFLHHHPPQHFLHHHPLQHFLYHLVLLLLLLLQQLTAPVAESNNRMM